MRIMLNRIILFKRHQMRKSFDGSEFKYQIIRFWIRTWANETEKRYNSVEWNFLR